MDRKIVKYVWRKILEVCNSFILSMKDFMKYKNVIMNE